MELIRMDSSQANSRIPEWPTRAGTGTKLRFGVFEVDLRNRELRKHGFRVKLQEKPFRILELLLARPGELVTREELASRLWPDLYVSFERSLNTAVNALRRTLCDSARVPRYIETRAGQGYVFVAAVQDAEDNPAGRLPMPGKQSEAFQDYLKGLYFYNKMTEQDLQRSAAHLEAALAQDPDFALASTGLADTLLQFAVLGIVPGRQVAARIKHLATVALRLDDRLAEAHASLAAIHRSIDRDWAAAESESSRALHLNSGCSSARRQHAALLAATGRFDEALNQIRRACQLEPLSLIPTTEMAWILCMARDFRVAADESWRALALEPRFAPAQQTLGLACEQLGQTEEAIIEFGNAVACSGQHPAALAGLAHAHAVAGNHREASRIVEQLEQMAQRRYVSSWWMAIARVGLGQHDAALSSLRQACEDRDVWLVWLAVEPRLDPLRSDPGFVELLRTTRKPAA